MNYFDAIIANKLFGQGSGEQKEEIALNVTENGTYNAPDGQTYNPVNVNVSATVEKPYMTYTVNLQNRIVGAKLYADVMPNYIFSGISTLVSVDLSENATLTSISQAAFLNCSNLTTIIFPEGLTSIGYESFASCNALTLEELPSSLTTIEAYAFKNCRNVTFTEIPIGVVSMEGGIFQNCTSLTSMVLPPNVFNFKSGLFYNCTNLASVTFTNVRAPYIDYSAFSGCSNLLDIYVPWAEGEVQYAPWGATNATIHYNWTEA